NINRHYYTVNEIDNEMQRPVVQELVRLMEFRNTHKAFDGDFLMMDCMEHELIIERSNGRHKAVLYADFKTKVTKIAYTDEKYNEKSMIL
ncbi:hypothetical protein CG709_21035, partial [Lachnotalea glycerini]